MRSIGLLNEGEYHRGPIFRGLVMALDHVRKQQTVTLVEALELLGPPDYSRSASDRRSALVYLMTDEGGRKWAAKLFFDGGGALTMIGYRGADPVALEGFRHGIGPLLAAAGQPLGALPPAGTGYLGITADAADSSAESPVVEAVEPKSAAAAAGVRERDVITKFGGEPAKGWRAADFDAAAARCRPGSVVKLTVRRESEPAGEIKDLEVRVVVAARPRH